MKLAKPFAIGATLLFASQVAIAVSSEDIDKLTTYAMVLGRSVACGNDIEEPMRRVGQWMDQVFPSGSPEQIAFLTIFMEGVRYHAEIQRDGRSPENCAAVQRSFNGFHWP